MLKQPAVLSSREIIELTAAAAKADTWVGAPVPVSVPERCGCGGHMVRRTRKSDGQPFLGCSHFPTCRRTKPLSD
jgi:hypothetical protein